MARFAPLLATVCGGVAAGGVLLPWYSWDGGDDPTIYSTRGIDAGALGTCALLLGLAGAVAAAICAASRSGHPGRSRAAWALSSLIALALTMLVALVAWVRQVAHDWRAWNLGITTGWSGTGLYVTFAAAVWGTIFAASMLAEVRRSSRAMPC